MFFINTDCLSKKETEILKAQIEQQAKERRMLELDYKTRLKDDIIAILEDLKVDIEAKINYYEQVYKEPSNLIHETAMCGRMFGCGECEELVQQKINEIKESKDE